MKKEKYLATQLSNKFNTRNPFKLASALDIDVRYEEMGKGLGYCDENFRIKAIHISVNAEEKYCPFICAHELGHLIMHTNMNTLFLSTYTLFPINKLEKEANLFAVELLLPDKLIMNHQSCSMECIANAVGIPEGFTFLKTLT